MALGSTGPQVRSLWQASNTRGDSYMATTPLFWASSAWELGWLGVWKAPELPCMELKAGMLQPGVLIEMCHCDGALAWCHCEIVAWDQSFGLLLHGSYWQDSLPSCWPARARLCICSNVTRMDSRLCAWSTIRDGLRKRLG